MTKYILASASPRRVEILSRLGFEFEAVPSEAEERLKEDFTSLAPLEKAERLSFIKAADVAFNLISKQETKEGDAYIIIGADTVVAAGDEILEKPIDREDAKRMIGMLEGKTHSVYTGVTLILLPRNLLAERNVSGESAYTELFKILENQMDEEKKEEEPQVEKIIEELKEEGKLSFRTFSEKTEVEVYPMNEAEIEGYTSGLEPYDKAGGYGIQGKFSAYIKRINGDYSNVVGLPAGRLYQEIKEVFRNNELQTY